MERRTDKQLQAAWESAGSDPERFAIRDEWREVVAAKRRGELTDSSATELAERTIKGATLTAGIRLKVGIDGPWDAEEEIPLKWRVSITAAESATSEKFFRIIEAVTLELRELGPDVLCASYTSKDDDTLVFDRCVVSQNQDEKWTCRWPIRCTFWWGPAGRLE